MGISNLRSKQQLSPIQNPKTKSTKLLGDFWKKNIYMKKKHIRICFFFKMKYSQVKKFYPFNRYNFGFRFVDWGKNSLNLRNISWPWFPTTRLLVLTQFLTWVIFPPHVGSHAHIPPRNQPPVPRGFPPPTVASPVVTPIYPCKNLIIRIVIIAWNIFDCNSWHTIFEILELISISWICVSALCDPQVVWHKPGFVWLQK